MLSFSINKEDGSKLQERKRILLLGWMEYMYKNENPKNKEEVNNLL